MKRSEWMRLSIALVIAIIFIGTGAARLPICTPRFSFMQSRFSIPS